MAEHTPVTDENVRFAQATDSEWAARCCPDASPLSDARVRNLIGAVAPLIAAAERERITEYRNAACAALRFAETASRYGNDPVTAQRYRTAREALEAGNA